MSPPGDYEARIRPGVEKAADHTLLPRPGHVGIRGHILETNARAKESAEDELLQRWKGLERGAIDIAEKTRGRARQLLEGLPTGVRKIWAGAHIGLLWRILREAGPVHGRGVAEFIIKGVPTVGTFPKVSENRPHC